MASTTHRQNENDEDAMLGDWEEEEDYILLELTGITHEEFMRSEHFQLIGVESQSPYLKLDKCVFRGQYKQTVGTSVFFEEENKKINNVPMMNYLCKTTKKLEMERVFLNPKTKKSESQKSDTPDEPDEAKSGEHKDTS